MEGGGSWPWSPTTSTASSNTPWGLMTRKKRLGKRGPAYANQWRDKVKTTTEASGMNALRVIGRASPRSPILVKLNGDADEWWHVWPEKGEIKQLNPKPRPKNQDPPIEVWTLSTLKGDPVTWCHTFKRANEISLGFSNLGLAVVVTGPKGRRIGGKLND